MTSVIRTRRAHRGLYNGQDPTVTDHSGIASQAMVSLIVSRITMHPDDNPYSESGWNRR